MKENISIFTENLKNNNIPFTLNESMKKHTTFKIGGEALVFIEPRSIDEIKKAAELAKENNVRLMPLGKGSNMLISDEGLPYAVLHLGDNFSGESIEGNTITVKAGTSLVRACRFAKEKGLTGMEELFGIPGSLGGAVYMNAGAYGGEMSKVVKSVTYLSCEGEVKTIDNAECDFSYRHSIFTDTDNIILSADFTLEKGEVSEIEAKMNDYMGRRTDKQPLNFPSAGSTFKRPEGAYASALIDRCGLKGFAIGGAEVSTKHAGFVINRGDATCADVAELIKKIQEIVKEKTGFTIEPEIKIIK